MKIRYYSNAVKLVKLYCLYMGYRLKVDPVTKEVFIIDGNNRINSVEKVDDNIVVYYGNRKDVIRPELIIKGLMERHGKMFPSILLRILK